MENRLVSIITPMCKGAAFVAETIESVQTQTYKNWEMIIVDDCSPDDGAGIREVEKYSTKDPRVILIKSKVNKGASGARNIALHEAKGGLIAFLDSDDIWHPDFLEKQLAFMREKDADIVFSSYRRIEETTKEDLLKPFIVPSFVCYKSILKSDPIFPSTAIFNREKIGDHFYDEKMGSMRDDFVFWLDVMKQGYTAHGNKEVLVDYRVRKSSVTGDKRKVIKPMWNVWFKHLKLGYVRSAYYFVQWTWISFWKYRN